MDDISHRYKGPLGAVAVFPRAGVRGRVDWESKTLYVTAAEDPADNTESFREAGWTIVYEADVTARTPRPA